MERRDLRIEGIAADAGAKLRLSPSGFKHSAVLLLAASPLLPSPFRIENIPRISDVIGMVRCLEHLGCSTKTENKVLTIDNAGLLSHQVPSFLTEDIHGPLYLIPAVLAKTGRATMGPFGGCRIGERSEGGSRPTKHVVEVLKRFGASVSEELNGVIDARLSRRGLVGTTIDVREWSSAVDLNRGPMVSGVTKVAILAALGVQKGRTTILNPYLRTETRDLLRVFSDSGWKIDQGSQHVEIEAQQRTGIKLESLQLPSDFVEIITYAALAVVANRTAEIVLTPSTDVELALAPELKVLRGMGVQCLIEANTLVVRPQAPHRSFELESGLPGIYSDNQPFFALMGSTCEGESIIRDHVWRNRFSYADDLRAMGIHLIVNDDYTEARVRSSSLRSGDLIVTGRDARAAGVLAIAAAARRGVTILRGAEALERGYDDLPGKLRTCGADVTLLDGEAGS